MLSIPTQVPKGLIVAHDLEEGFFNSSDSLKLFYHLRRNSQAKATLVAVHGLGEHMGRYMELFSEIAHPDLQFAGFDLRGSGRSEGAPADVASFDDYLNDLSAFLLFLSQQCRTLSGHSWILFGHSLGGLIALQWAQKYGDQLSALILSAPFLGFRAACGVKFLNRVVRVFFPHFVYQNPVYPTHLSHDAEEVAKYRKDPYIRRMISARLIDIILKETEGVQCMAAISLKMPVLGLLAGDERVVDGEAGRRVLNRILAPSKEIKTYSNFYHETFHEVNRQEVFRDLRSYLQTLLA